VPERETFDALTILLADSIAATRGLLYGKFKIAPRTKRAKLFALLALNHLMQKCESIAAMARAEAYAGINVTARSAFETYADVLNLFKHPDTYPDYMTWVSFKQQDSLFRLGFSGETPHAETLDKMARSESGKSVKDMIAEMTLNLGEIEARLPTLYRNTKGNVQDRDMLKFELAGRVNEYNALFRHLSGSTHGRISAMGDGIFDTDDITWPPAKPVGRPLAAVDSACAMLIECSDLLARKSERSHSQFTALNSRRAAVGAGIIPWIGQRSK
jgi:hypothetical protein